MKVLITPTSLSREQDHAALEPLRRAGATLVFNPYARPLSAAELIGLLPGVDAVVAGLDSFTAEVFDSADQLQVVARYAVGYDRIYRIAAADAGVVITNTPGANAQAVAELAVGLMFAVARQIPQVAHSVGSGEWPRVTGVEIARRRLGLLGVGAIGSSVAAMAQGLGMSVSASDPGMSDDRLREQKITPVGVEELLATSDILSLHAPLVDSTAQIIRAETLAQLPSQAILINTARGGLVKEKDVVAALDAGTLFGMGVDAYSTEPPLDSPLVGHPRVVATPHSGAHSQESVQRTAAAAVDNVMAVWEGRQPPGLVS